MTDGKEREDCVHRAQTGTGDSPFGKAASEHLAVRYPWTGWGISHFRQILFPQVSLIKSGHSSAVCGMVVAKCANSQCDERFISTDQENFFSFPRDSGSVQTEVRWRNSGCAESAHGTSRFFRGPLHGEGPRSHCFLNIRSSDGSEPPSHLLWSQVRQSPV